MRALFKLVINCSLFLLVVLVTITQVEVVQVLVQPINEPKPIKVNTVYEIATTTQLPLSSHNPVPNTAYSDIYNYKGDFSLNQTFAELMVFHHNSKRELHQSQPLAWNSTLFEFAASYASGYDCSGVLTHSGNAYYGENLAIGYSPVGAINAWYNEGNTYDYTNHGTFDHFTAMIWNHTNAIGCAARYCNEVWGSYIICSYYPPGNMVGQSLENVFPPS